MTTLPGFTVQEIEQLSNEVLYSNIGAPFLPMKRCSVMEAHSFPILYNSEPTAGQRGS